MRFVHLKVDNLMGCNYEIEFDERYTVIIGRNRQGKTLIARLIMLCFYGIKMPKELNDSWKLKEGELLPYSDSGSVTLIFEKDGRKYKIERSFDRKRHGKSKAILSEEYKGKWRELAHKDSDLKRIVIDELEIAPVLMNVVMTNEQSLIGSISYDEEMQRDIWKGWEAKEDTIRNNFKNARNRCITELKKLRIDTDEHNERIKDIVLKWVNKGIFSLEETSAGIDENKVKNKQKEIDEKIKTINDKLTHYDMFYRELTQQKELEKRACIENIIKTCTEHSEFIDEDVTVLNTECEQYLKLLDTVLDRGGRKGIEEEIRRLEDEKQKLDAARDIKKRKTPPVEVVCEIYPPENSKDMVVQIPYDVATRFRYEEIKTANVAVPYDSKKEKEITDKITELRNILLEFEGGKDKISNLISQAENEIYKRKNELSVEKSNLEEQRIIIDTDWENYSRFKRIVDENQRIIKRFEIAENWLGEFYNKLSEEETPKRLRRETVNFINHIYDKIYRWDIEAHLEQEEKIYITDRMGNIRTHISGSETHVMGLAWRWIVARIFNLPIVMDELDALLDDQNFENTKRLIQDEMDRQTIILTMREGLKTLQGKVYWIERKEGISTIHAE